MFTFYIKIPNKISCEPKHLLNLQTTTLMNLVDKIKKYLTKRKDPLLNGPFRGQIKNGFSTLIQHEKTYKKITFL